MLLCISFILNLVFLSSYTKMKYRRGTVREQKLYNTYTILFDRVQWQN